MSKKSCPFYGCFKGGVKTVCVRNTNSTFRDSSTYFFISTVIVQYSSVQFLSCSFKINFMSTVIVQYNIVQFLSCSFKINFMSTVILQYSSVQYLSCNFKINEA